ncbi:helix-turn-helix domain-containing protein [Oceanobacillus profundus]|uniref:helix-turn-helix transcriptional regulator n=1 Tax=Oceanobacillus profundus TaxID=372463 RepID=UPI00203DB01A|nr:helix-turn-helix transcriptional regulator [Oceanobacillus profundus]MCM3398133.1 helix-turn-helix domain-containing protein [Oceanobacillus profundus]
MLLRGSLRLDRETIIVELLGDEEIKFPQKLKEERLKREMSQQQLGELHNINRQSISKWERGEGYPGIELLIQLSEIFDITIDELLKGDDHLKEQIIEDGKQLAYPKLKLFFDVLLVMGLLLVASKILILIGNKFLNLDITFFQGSILYATIPFITSIIGGIGSETLSKKYESE